jgi:signal transduction histidine kinase
MLSWLRLKVGLGTKMAVIVTIGTISFIAVFAYLGTAALDETIQKSLQERVVIAQITARNVDQIINNINNVLTTTVAEEDWSDQANLNLAMDRTYHRLGFISKQIFLLDLSGQVIVARPPIEATVSFENFESVKSVLNGKTFAVSRFTRPIGSTYSSTVASTPVRDASDNILGALAISIDLTAPYVRIFTDPIGLGNTGYMDLVDLGGVILASTRQERVGLESDHGETLKGLIRDHRQVVSTCHDCHTIESAPQPIREVLAFAPLEEAEWGIAIRQSEDEAFNGIHLLQFRIFAVAVLMLAGGLTLVYFTTRSVLRPVRALISATKRIAEGDLDTPLKVSGQDEISTLANSFDAMRARLKDSMSEIKAWNRELDDRVQEQTTAYRQTLQQNSLLLAELQHKEQSRVKLLRQVISAQEEERKRISRELHDETSQMVAALAYKLDDADEAAVSPEMHKLLEQMHMMTEETQVELHRIIMDLRPTMLDHLGLIPALRWYVEMRFKDLGIRHNIRVLGNIHRLAPAVEITLFRVVQEAINNIARHSQARLADFVFEFSSDRVEVRISDNGVGFDMASVEGGSDEHRGLGLMGMAERMSTIDGEFRLRSMPGQGTTIELVVKWEKTGNVEDSDSGRR